ncbi:MAG: peptidylprolyl isomerase [Anaerolineales bacterium]|nr:peptidylprolyl isomerase [Anaerolineales bacterium]
MPLVMVNSRAIVALSIGLLGIAGCGRIPLAILNPSPPPPSATPMPPTPTPQPLAANVNGEGILLELFELEVIRFEYSKTDSGIDLATLYAYRSALLESMIDIVLLGQGARANGYKVEETEIDDRLNRMIESAGDWGEFELWMELNGYTQESLRIAMVEEIEAAWMVAYITDQVADAADQVHARHILVASEAEAEGLRAQLQDGVDFDLLARQYSIDASTRPAGGDLGWFPQGFLLWPEVEMVAFSLQPGEISTVVMSGIGYHIIETMEREERLLAYSVKQVLSERSIESWITTERATADIQTFITQ